MTEDQREDLMVEWSLYGPERRKKVIAEFLLTYDGTYSQEEWLNFLKDKLKQFWTSSFGRHFGKNFTSQLKSYKWTWIAGFTSTIMNGLIVDIAIRAGDRLKLWIGENLIVRR